MIANNAYIFLSSIFTTRKMYHNETLQTPIIPFHILRYQHIVDLYYDTLINKQTKSNGVEINFVYTSL